MKNIDMKNCFIHTKIRNKMMKRARIELSFFAIFCDFDKQKDQQITINIIREITEINSNKSHNKNEMEM